MKLSAIPKVNPIEISRIRSKKFTTLHREFFSRTMDHPAHMQGKKKTRMSGIAIRPSNINPKLIKALLPQDLLPSSN